MPDELREPLGQRRSGQPDFAGERLERPLVGRAAVQRRQRAPHERLAQPREPASLIRGQRLEVAADDIYEHQLAETPEHAFAAEPRLLRLGDRELDERVDGPARAVADADDGGQRRQQGIERPRVAPQEPADKARRFLGAVAHGDREGQLSVARRPVHRHVRRLTHTGRARHRVPVALREDDDVAGREADGRAPVDGRPAGAVRHHVVGNEVLGAREHPADDRRPRRRLGDPRLRRVHVEEDGARQANRAQHIRQRIHR